MGGKQILVVEDDKAVREVLTDVLSAESYSVVQARHGQEALELLQRGVNPHLLLLDLMMPVMTGWQLLEALQGDSRFHTIPVVVFSAAAQGLDVKGACEVLEKPLNLDTLLDAIGRNIA